MRKLLSCLSSMLIMLALQGQAPAQLNYQGIARKPNGHSIPNDNISIRLSIHDGSAAGPVVYRETRLVTTNAFGLFNVAIGSPGATGVIGSIALVNWATGGKYLQVELDPDGGSSFTNLGTSQLLSVPYALYAGGAPPVGPAGGDLTGTYPNPTVARIRGVNVTTVAPLVNNILGFDGTNWTPVSLATHPDNYWRFLAGNIYNANGGNVGIGVAMPTEKLQVNGNLKTLGFIMPTGAGAGKFLKSDVVGNGSWSSTIAATSIVLPYKDSASSETEHIFHIIQTSPTSATGALFGVTRSTGYGAFGTGGQVSSSSAGAYSAGVRGENLGTGGNGIGVYGIQYGSGYGVYGYTPSGIGTVGLSNSYYGVFGSSNTNSGVFGTSNSGAGYLAGVFGYATNEGGNGTFGYANRKNGFGALGISDSSTGVYGQTGSSTYEAFVNDGVAVYALATSGGLGVYGRSFGNNAARFENINVANTTDAVLAKTNSTSILTATVHAINGTSAGVFPASRKAMWGETDNGVGVYGGANSGIGVFGIGLTGNGVQGLSFSGFAGVSASHNDAGLGLFAYSVNGTSGRFYQGVGANANNVLEALSDGMGRSGFFQNTNASNASTTLEANSNGTGRAIVGRSNFGGYINAGVIDGLTSTLGGNAVFGRGLRVDAWGIFGLSDSSAGVAGIGIRAGSIGVLGQSYSGTAGRFVIDNTLVNTSNAVEVSNSQSGNGITVDLTNVTNAARGIDVMHAGTGIGVYSNSNLGLAGRFENTNPSNASTTLESISNGTGRAIVGRSNFGGYINAGVIDGMTTTLGGNAVFGRGVRVDAWGIFGLSDSSAGVAGIGIRASSIGVLGQSYSGMAGRFVIDNSLPNTSNTVEISNSQTGKGLLVNMTNVASTANGIEVNHDGSGIGLYANSNLGLSGRFENTNAANVSTTLEAISNGTGRAIVGRSNFGGYINAGVIDGLTTTLGGNAVFGRGLRVDAWGIFGLSDSSAGVAGIGIRAGSLGVFGQSYGGTAGRFVIDNTLANPSNAVEVFNSQTGKGIQVNITNAANTANGIEVNHNGSGNGMYAKSQLGIAGRFENTNAANTSDLILSTTNGLGRAMEGFNTNPINNVSTIRGETNGTGNGVAGVGTNDNTFNAGVYGFHSGRQGNGVIGYGTKSLTYGVIGHSDSSVGVYGESGLGNAAYFLSYGTNASVPTLYAQSNALSNVASFYAANANNSADAVTINRVGAGRSLFVDMTSFANPMNFYDVVNTGKQTARIEGSAGLGLLAHAGGTFTHTVAGERVGIGVYGQADSTGSQYNYGLVGNARGGSVENAGVIGWIASGAAGASKNAAIYGVAFAGPGPRFAGLFEGDVQVTGILSKGGGSFKIDHPQDPENKYLIHSFVESPDMMNVYNGNVVTDATGKAVVDLPGYFEAENKDFKYQLTVIGQFAQAIIGEEIKSNQFTILTDKPSVKVSWQVTGVRNDAFAQKNRIVPEVEKTGGEKGKYLYPELYGQSREDGITFMKTGLPTFQGEGKSSASAAARATENKAMSRVNDGVEQKRRMLSSQLEQSAIQTAKLIESKPADNSMKIPVEKSKQLAATIDVKQPESKVQEQEKPTATPNNSDKAKQLSTMIETAQATAQKKTEETKARPVPTSSEKIKQLATSTAVSKEEGSNKVDKAKLPTDSLKITVDQSQKAGAKSQTPASAADVKKLSKPEIKLPAVEKPNAKKD